MLFGVSIYHSNSFVIGKHFHLSDNVTSFPVGRGVMALLCALACSPKAFKDQRQRGLFSFPSVYS